MREVDLAKIVVSHLEDEYWDYWDVYQEVPCESGVADIVAVARGRVFAVECKVSLTFSVIEQAIARQRQAHWVAVAVPRARRGWLARDILKKRGIGLLTVAGGQIYESLDAKLNRAGHEGAKRLIETLQPEHKTFAQAGTSTGRYWTPWRATCREALRYVSRHGTVPAIEMVKGISHHYRSNNAARACLVMWLREGKVPGLRIIEGRPLRVALKEQKKTQTKVKKP